MTVPSSKWPYDPANFSVASSINWMEADSLAFRSPIQVWKKVKASDANALRRDVRYKAIYASLDADTKAIIDSIADGAPIRRPSPIQPKGDSTKDDILGQVENVIADAEAEGDTTARLKGIELLAKLHQLLSQKPIEDKEIVINVVTGVERE